MKSGRQRDSDMPANARMIIGRNAVAALLQDPSSTIVRLLIVSDEKGRARDLVDQAQRRDIPIEFCSRHDLTARAGSESHQGFVAIAPPIALGSRQELLELCQERGRFLLVALDGVTDPHNLGAVLRASECFGADGVLWSKNRSPGITPVVTKVAVGATELLPLFEVSNLADTLLALQKECGASIVCADGGGSAVDVAQHLPDSRTVLVMGSEGEGVSDLVRRRSDATVKIPMHGQIDSLNVSQAAAVLLYSLKSRLGS